MKKITLLLLMLLVSITGYSQLALEGFETGTLTPDPLPSTNWTLGTGNWAVFDNGVGLTYRWGTSATNVCAGTLIGYMRNENIGAGNTSEDYLSTPAFTVPTNGELHFKTRSFQSGNQGTIYQIKIAPATANQTDPSSYTLVQQYTEAELTAVFNVCEEKVVSLNAYAGLNVYVAFVMVVNQTGTSLSDRWLVDDVSVDAACLIPTTLTTSGITQNGASLNWANPSGATSWEIEIVPAAGTPTGVGTVYSLALPYIVTGLTPNTPYKYYVRALCSPSGYASAWAGPSANFTTLIAPPVCGGNYVDTGGTTANYGNNENNTITICPVTPGDKVTVAFTAFNTELGADILSIYDGDNASATLLGSFSGTTIPPTFSSSATSGCLTFVFVSNATTVAAGWAANVTCAPPPACQQPVALNTTALLSTSVNFGWTNIGAATSWQVLALPCGSPAPTAATVGWTATTSNPYSFTTLTPNTCYDLYVRGDCSSTSNGVSLWSGPRSVTTQIAPPVCGGNFVDSGSTTANYGNNENITTTICPVTPGDVVTVTFTAFNTQAGQDILSVYNGNDTTGTLIGTYSGTTLPPALTSSSANGCLTFVFTSNATTTSTGWASNITCSPPPACAQPIGLTTTALLSSSVNFGWTSPGPATSWQVLALPCGSPAPTATSTGITTTTNPYAFTGLTPNTCYDLYVISDCSSTANGFSTWSGPRTVTTTTAPPICGGNFVDSGGPTGNYANGENITTTICPTTPGELVTVTFTAFNVENNFDFLKIYDGDSATAPLLANLTGIALPPSFTSSAANGCLTFVFTSDGSVTPAGWITNITCAPPPACQKPTALTTTALTSNSVTLGWTNVGLATSWQVLALPCGSPAPTATSTGWIATTANPYTFTGLSSSTCYDLYVRGDCSSSSNGVSLWTGPISVTTQVAPPICGGNFVDAAGPTANYANNSNVTTTICPTNPGEIVTVTFTTFDTEVNFDGLYVYDGNAVIPANQIASANPAGAVPGGLAGSYWGTAIPGPFVSTTADGCLTFVFRSDGSVQRPGWTANITCSPAPTCARPILVTATAVTQTSATLTWNQPLNPDGSQATAWEILLLPAGSPIPVTAGIPATSPYLATGLTAGTAYVFYVRAICSATDQSVWSALNFAALPVNDECINATFAIVNQNLNCVQTTPGTLSGATASLPVTTCPGVANDDVWFTFTATAVTHVISFNNVSLPAPALNYAIFTGTDCGSLTQVGCNTGANLIPGTTYYIRVYSATAIQQYTTFNLCIGTLPCTEAPAFCTGQTVTYANATNVPSLGTIGCLGTSPNPAFFFLQVNQAGPLSYLISQVTTAGAPIDVDYVAWGPFTDLQVACSGVPANPLPSSVPLSTVASGCPGTIHACSYSTAAQEIMCLPAAQLCEVYVIMITNFANQAGTVTFTQTNTGGGTTECFPINTFNYPLTYYCQDGVNPTPVLAPGASAGTYSSTAGLVIDPVTGTIDLAASTPGPYIVTSTTLTSTGGVCTNIPSITTTRTVIITAPASATIAYSAPAFCNTSIDQQAVLLTGSIGGTYTASPAGLLINQNTGAILPIASLPGTYTITYAIAAFGGCAAFTTTTTVEILDAPVPTFTQVAPICPGDPLADLPTTSDNSITGTWSPAMNNTATTTYTFTPTTGICARTTTMTIGVGTTTPDFVQVAPICPDAPLADLPTTSPNGVTGTWSPPMDNTTTTTYTFTPTPGVCAGVVTMTIQVLPLTIVPTFPNVAPICPNGVLAALPTTSNNGITGIWSPTLDNTATTTYTFTPDPAQCALDTTLTIIVNPELEVTVNSTSICPGSTATVTATPAIPGTYSYAWTVPAGFPDPGNVASFTTSTVGDYSVVITQVNSFCNTDFESPAATGAFPNLFNENLVPCWDTTSSDGIIEIWPPGFEGTFAYSGNQLIELNGNFPGALFQDFNVIPGTSISISFAHRGRQGNDVVGVEIGPLGGPYVSLGNFTDGNTAWVLHSLNYTIPTGAGNDYTLRFVSVSAAGGSPSIGNLLDAISISSLSCPSQPATGTVSLIPTDNPIFSPIADICLNSTAPLLPAVSDNGISGTWSPSTIDTSVVGTVTYTFTSTSGLCVTTATLDVTIVDQIVPLFNAIANICQNSTATSLPLTSTNGIIGTWNPPTIDTSIAGTVTYTFTPDAIPGQECAVATTIAVTIDTQVITTFNPIANICQNGTATLLPGNSIEGIAGTWLPNSIDTTVSGTVTYTFTPNSGICATTATLDVTIDAPTQPLFNQITNICINGTAPSLPTSSTNGGITGVWNPTTIDTAIAGTVTYTFTPDVSFCATQAIMNITIDPLTVTSFTQIGDICQGANAVTLPLTSSNGIAGSWNPPTIDTSTAGTVTYTFTPNIGLCASVATMNITIHPTPDVAPISDVTACDSYTLPTLTSGNYFSATGGQQPITNLTLTTSQTVYVFDQSGTTPNCTDEESFEVTISNSPQVTVDGGCVGPFYTLTASPIGNSFDPNAVTYSWEDTTGNPIGGNTQSIVVTEQGDYSVTVTSNGCSGTSAAFNADSITCVIQKGISVNSSPDGLNDCFDLEGFNVKKLSIFNRYGMKVYSKNDYTNQWCGQSDNGDELPDGTYYYVIERDNGETKTGWIYINKQN